MKRFLGLAVGVLLLAGCAAPSPVVRPEPSPDPAASGDRPPSAFDIGCDDLVPIADLRSIWGSELAPAPYNEAGSQGSWEMQGTALIQDGALTCRWSLPGQENRVTVIALDDAVEGYDRTEPAFLADTRFEYVPAAIGDGAQTYCRSEDGPPLCHWNVLVGDAWISLFFEDVASSELAPEGGAQTVGTPLAQVAQEIIASVAASPRTAVDRVSDSLEPCHDSLEQAQLADALEVPTDEVSGSAGRPLEYALGASTPDFGQTMWAYSYERLGYYECYFGTESITGSVITAPGAAWILDDPAALQGDTKEVDGLGRGTSDCRAEGDDFTLCTVAIAVGDDLALVSLAPKDSAHGLDLALAVAALVVP